MELWDFRRGCDCEELEILPMFLLFGWEKIKNIVSLSRWRDLELDFSEQECFVAAFKDHFLGLPVVV
ncbi:MAG: hypothetical protein QXP01_08750 [Candidatus Hadarchaeum sp.]